MKSRRTPCRRPAAKARASAGFTLVEVLAALLFMAIVIPVAMEGVRIASLAGEVGERKVVAARVAERVLNELLVTDGLRQTSASGSVEEGIRRFNWTMRSEAWSVASLNLVTIRVVFTAQGNEYEVNLSTLYSSDTQSTSTTTTTTSTQ